MLMWFLFQKHILLIKSKECYWLVGGPAVVGSLFHRARLTATECQRLEAHVVCAGGHGCVHTRGIVAGKFLQSTYSSLVTDTEAVTIKGSNRPWSNRAGFSHPPTA